jgi:hypothetical protein
MRRFRHRGVGRSMATFLWNEHPGEWLVRVLEANAPALTFWRGEISIYSHGLYREDPTSSMDVPGYSPLRAESCFARSVSRLVAGIYQPLGRSFRIAPGFPPTGSWSLPRYTGFARDGGVRGKHSNEVAARIVFSLTSFQSGCNLMKALRVPPVRG